MSRRRTVTFCESTPRKARKGGGQRRMWAFGIATLAELFGITEAAVRQRLRVGTLKPHDLRALLEGLALAQGWTPPPGKTP